MKLDPDQWQALSRLVDQALALPPQARAGWLASLAGEAAGYRALLGDMLQGPPADVDVLSAPLPMPSAADEHQPGDAVGPYRLLTLLGRGGMASVWLAERTDGRWSRQVALKLPCMSGPSRAMAERFARERDILAALEHPYIARLYDAGVTDRGQPYLAMERVQGSPIDQHADGARLGIEQRLRLFVQVLEAVQYAHGRLVLHRDLKPSNILVTAEGQVRLVDFGIARLMDSPRVGDSAITRSAGRALTLDYASPEQVLGQPLGTASDLYSLGVVLYELLCGQRPYRLPRESAAALEEAIAEAEAVAPSRVVRNGADAPAVAARRGLRPKALSRRLAGDLDTVVLKALRKAPADRYVSADALRQDLQRHLDGQPVLARRDQPWYRLGKFVRRNRTSVAAAGAVVLALAVGLCVALWQADKARQEARRAEAVQALLVKLFTGNEPERARGAQLSARDLLKAGSRSLDEELKDQPWVQADLHSRLGGIYISLGENLEAKPHLEKALRLYASLGQTGSERHLDTMALLSEVLQEELQFDDASAVCERVLALAQRAHGEVNRWAPPMLQRLAWMAQERGDSARAVQLLHRALPLQERVGGRHSVVYVRLLSDLAQLDAREGRYGAARERQAEVMALSAATPGYEVTDQLVDRYSMARILYNLQELGEAQRMLVALLPEMDRHIGPQHDRTLKARALLAQALLDGGRPADALSVQRENLAHATARKTLDQEVVQFQRLVLAKILKVLGQHAEGAAAAEEGLRFMEAKYPAPNWVRERARWVLAENLQGLGRRDEALARLEQARTNMLTLPGHEEHTAYADVLQSLAVARHAAGDHTQAARLAAQAAGIESKQRSAGAPAALRARLVSIWLSEAVQDKSALARWRTDAASLRAASPQNPLLRAELDWMEADLLAKAGMQAEARALADAAQAAYRKSAGKPMATPPALLH